jgi:electron transport complex protein RnfD
VSRIPDLFFGSVAGSLGETSALAILLGGIYLFYKGVIDYRIPVGIGATVAVFALLAGENPVFHLLAEACFLVPCTWPRTW